MDLAKAMTVRGFSARHRTHNGGAEREQQQEGADRPPACGRHEQQRDRNRKLGKWQHDAAEPGGTRLHAELHERTARAPEIQQLADRGNDEHRREQATDAQ